MGLIQSDFKFVKDDIKKHSFFNACIPSQYWNMKFKPILKATKYTFNESEYIYRDKDIQADWWKNISDKIRKSKSKKSIGIFPAYEKQEDLAIKGMFHLLKTLLINDVKCISKNTLIEHSDKITSDSGKYDVVGLYGNSKKDSVFMTNCLRAHILSQSHCIFSFGSPFDVFLDTFGIKPTMTITISKEA